MSGRFPPPKAYIASATVLGFDFRYPDAYLPSIAWDQVDFENGNDGHCLSFLTSEEVAKHLPSTRKATDLHLVPFARGEDGDLLFCFDADSEKDVFVIDLGRQPLAPQLVGKSGYVAFLNEYRANHGLPSWNQD